VKEKERREDLKLKNKIKKKYAGLRVNQCRIKKSKRVMNASI
jgi:hypothetical protein